jgi:ureidoglycolate hydrolase
VLKTLEIKALTTKNFGKYGRILFPTEEENKTIQDHSVAYIVLEKAVSKGWLMSHYSVSKRFTDIMENHPNTKETFEPLCGASIIILAHGPTPENPEAFLLDKPVVLYEGVWHDVLALSENATMRINENTEVQSVRQKLPYTIKAELCTEPNKKS